MFLTGMAGAKNRRSFVPVRGGWCKEPSVFCTSAERLLQKRRNDDYAWFASGYVALFAETDGNQTVGGGRSGRKCFLCVVYSQTPVY